MCLEDRKRVSRGLLELWASVHEGKPEDLVTPGYVNHQEPDVDGGISVKDLAEWKELLTAYHESFSNSTVRILMQVGEGDLVATRWEFTATNTGELLGEPATGRKTVWTGVAIDRFEGDRAAESWVSWDKYRFLEGLDRLR
jgi:predicted ester cyclase